MQFSKHMVYLSAFALGMAVDKTVKQRVDRWARSAHPHQRPTRAGDRYNILKIDHEDELTVVHSS